MAATIKRLETHEVGEWIDVGGLLTDPRTGNPMDVTGCTVSVTVRSGKASTDPLIITTNGSVVDGPGGDVDVGFRINVAGTYYGTVTVDNGGAPGWPVEAQFSVPVVDRP